MKEGTDLIQFFFIFFIVLEMFGLLVQSRRGWAEWNRIFPPTCWKLTWGNNLSEGHFHFFVWFCSSIRCCIFIWHYLRLIFHTTLSSRSLAQQEAASSKFSARPQLRKLLPLLIGQVSRVWIVYWGTFTMPNVQLNQLLLADRKCEEEFKNDVAAWLDCEVFVCWCDSDVARKNYVFISQNKRMTQDKKRKALEGALNRKAFGEWRTRRTGQFMFNS
jgi:hypothetical protein